MSETAHELVQRGAALLDARLPGWADQIDLDTLELASGCDCVLGQLVATGKRVNLEALGVEEPEHWGANEASYEEAIDGLGVNGALYGFSIMQGIDHTARADEWVTLQDAWKGEIVARRTL